VVAARFACQFALNRFPIFALNASPNGSLPDAVEQPR
jgi:hypothetical protein